MSRRRAQGQGANSLRRLGKERSLYRFLIYAAVWLLEDKVELQISKNKILENRNNRLNEEVLDLKSGYEVIEERARFDLGMIRRNESFYMVVTSSNLR